MADVNSFSSPKKKKNIHTILVCLYLSIKKNLKNIVSFCIFFDQIPNETIPNHKSDF